MTDLATIAMPRTVRRTHARAIRDMVARRYNLTDAEIEGDCRRLVYIGPRHIAMYLMMKYTRIGSLRIGKLFNGRDHSTVIHAVRKIENMVAADPTFAAEVAELADMIEGAQ